MKMALLFYLAIAYQEKLGWGIKIETNSYSVNFKRMCPNTGCGAGDPHLFLQSKRYCGGGDATWRI